MKKATKVQKKAAPRKKKSAAARPSPKKAVRKPARTAAKVKAASKPVRSAKPDKKAKKAAAVKTPNRRTKAAKPAKPAQSAKGGKKKVLCEFCGKPIPALRIEALPDTTTCVECSQTKPYSEAQIIGLNGEEADQNRLNVEDFEET
ncbi:TraR/DksA C4-type zinc finger protein, partial [bacterium]|nr:TraR/DksA C4-type zinc finger protein [bacterium]